MINGKGIPLTGDPPNSFLCSPAGAGTLGGSDCSPAVREFLGEMPRQDQPQALLDNLVALLHGALGFSRLDLFVFDEALAMLVRVRSVPQRNLLPPDGLAPNCPIVRFFQARSVPYLDLAGAAEDSGATPLRVAAQEQLRQMEHELALPLLSRARLIGLLALGPRTTDSPCAPQVRNCLSCLARALGNTLDRLWEEEGLDLIGRISRGLAHDLQNLLTPVTSYVQLSAEGEPSLQNAERLLPLALRNLDLMKLQLQHARHLAVDRRPRLEPRRLDQVVRKGIAGMTEELARRQVTIICDHLPEIVADIDEVAVLRLITNLLSNAINASPPGSQIRVELSRTRTPEGDMAAELSIRDPGVGIPPEQLARLLAPRLLRDSSSDGAKGGGLGLAICRQIVALHGGRLELRSEPGRGTTALVRLPAQSCERWKQMAPPSTKIN